MRMEQDQSEVTHLREQIDAEYQAAWAGHMASVRGRHAMISFRKIWSAWPRSASN
jgi:hypothetical protein